MSDPGLMATCRSAMALVRVKRGSLCYDRLKDDREPACAQACPTQSIQFGDLVELRQRAETRVRKLRDAG
jgi:formate dehydrogenase iron-sulfur subunit